MPTYGADYVSMANDVVVTLAMVETVEALENVEAIAGTPGLTGIYVGPSDLALSMGHTPKLDPEEPAVVEAVERILGACRDAGIRSGMHCLEPSYAKRMIDLGFDLVTLGSDVRLYTAACASASSPSGLPSRSCTSHASSPRVRALGSALPTSSEAMRTRRRAR